MSDRFTIGLHYAEELPSIVRAELEQLVIALQTQIPKLLAQTGTSGTYMPTLTAVLNATGLVPFRAHYVRVGDIVMVSGALTIDPVAAGTVTVNLSLPIASNFDTSATSANGLATNNGVGPYIPLAAVIRGDSVANAAQMGFEAVTLTAQSWRYVYTYKVL